MKQVQIDADTVMIFGGSPTSNANDAIKKIFTLKISANRWTEEATVLQYVRSGAICGLYDNTKVIIGGGRKVGTVEIFDLQTRTFAGIGKR